MDKPIILYDGFCNLCNASVRYILLADKRQIFKFEPLQSNVSKQILAQLIEIPDAVILVYKSKYYFRSNAVLKIASLLGFPYSLLSVFYLIPRPIRDFFYGLIATSRYQLFGKKYTCSINFDHKKRSPKLWTPLKQ